MKRPLLLALLVASVVGAAATLSVVVGSTLHSPTSQLAVQVAAGAQKLFESGQREEAINALEEALKLSPNSLIARRELAMELVAMGRPEAAIEQLEIVVKDSPGDPGAAATLADTLWQTGQHDRAITYLRRACKLEPTNGMHWVTLASWLLLSGNVEGALPAAQNAVEYAEGVPDAHLALGFALWRTGNPQAAEKPFRKVLALDPGNPVALRALAQLEAHPSAAPPLPFKQL